MRGIIAPDTVAAIATSAVRDSELRILILRSQCQPACNEEMREECKNQKDNNPECPARSARIATVRTTGMGACKALYAWNAVTGV